MPLTTAASRQGRTLPKCIAGLGVINFTLNDFAALFAASASHPFFAGASPPIMLLLVGSLHTVVVTAP
jgi:hypothetical protein